MRKVRLIERTYGNGETRWMIEEKSLFGWNILNEDLIGHFFPKLYKSKEKAMKAFSKINKNPNTKVIMK